MAKGKNIGTIFVELSLDDKVYKQKLSEDLQGAQATARGVETSWRALGVRSNAYFDQQRKAAINAFTLIKNSASSTAQDIVRAEAAKNAKIKAIYEQQYNTASSSASRMLSQYRSGWENATTATNKHSESIAGLTRGILRLYAAYYVLSNGIRGVVNIIQSGIEAIDAFKLSTVQTAAIMTGMMEADNRSLADRYKEAYGYASQLNRMLEEVDKNTMLNFQQLQGISSEMMKQGVIVDTNSKSQIQAFTQISNALATISQGAPNKEIQLRQEIRALLSGQVRATDQLAMMLDAQLNGKLKEELKLHKQAGDTVEWLGKQLSGFAAAQGDINASWETAKSSLQTVYNQVLRQGFQKAYNDIIAGTQKLSEWAVNHKYEIGEVINSGWNVLKGTINGIITPVKTIIDLTQQFKTEIYAVGSAIVAMNLARMLTNMNGLIAATRELIVVMEILGYRALTLVASKFGLIGIAIGTIVYGYEKLSRPEAIDSQIERLEKLKKRAEATGQGVADINAQLDILYQKRASRADSSPYLYRTPELNVPEGTLSPPKMKPLADPSADAATKKVHDAMRSWLTKIEELNPSLDPFEKKLVGLREEAEKLTAKFGKLPWIMKGLSQGEEFLRIEKMLKSVVNDLDEYEFYSGHMEGPFTEKDIEITRDYITAMDDFDESFATATTNARNELEALLIAEKNVVNKGKTGFDELKTAIDGWGKDSAKAIAEFAITGKESFSDMAESIISDMMQMIMYQNLIGPLFNKISTGDWLKSASSWFSSSDYSAGYSTGYGEWTGGLGFHGGGRVGLDTPSFVRNLPAAIFAHAPRLHKGLDADEYPAILQAGETVIPKGKSAQSGGGQTFIVHMENPTFQDTDTLNRTMVAIADKVARQVAPSAVVQSYRNDETIRKLIRERP